LLVQADRKMPDGYSDDEFEAPSGRGVSATVAALSVCALLAAQKLCQLCWFAYARCTVH
jgi:hypothetical protein